MKRKANITHIKSSIEGQHLHQLSSLHQSSEDVQSLNIGSKSSVMTPSVHIRNQMNHQMSQIEHIQTQLGNLRPFQPISHCNGSPDIQSHICSEKEFLDEKYIFDK